MTITELAAQVAELEARIAEIEATPTVAKSISDTRVRRELIEAAQRQERARLEKSRAAAEAETAARERRLAAAEKVANESTWIRVSAPHGWSSSYPIPAATRSYLSIAHWGSLEIDVATWKSWIARGDATGELVEAVATGELELSPLPANFDQLDTGRRLRLENEWRGARSAAR
jgi:multidrug efflux pump subunit AcrA (membrane-fusion protein)